MMTAWAGKLTPQASVAVHTRTFMYPLENMCSTSVRSCRNIPAWWIPKPSGNISLTCLFLERCTCCTHIITHTGLEWVGYIGGKAHLIFFTCKLLESTQTHCCTFLNIRFTMHMWRILDAIAGRNSKLISWWNFGQQLAIQKPPLNMGVSKLFERGPVCANIPSKSHNLFVCMRKSSSESFGNKALKWYILQLIHWYRRLSAVSNLGCVWNHILLSRKHFFWICIYFETLKKSKFYIVWMCVVWM